MVTNSAGVPETFSASRNESMAGSMLRGKMQISNEARDVVWNIPNPMEDPGVLFVRIALHKRRFILKNAAFGDLLDQ